MTALGLSTFGEYQDYLVAIVVVRVASVPD
jgi:hypothetical protein